MFNPSACPNFTVMHIGDSHVQGASWGAQLRDRLSENRSVNQTGFLFPYSVVKSYGPKGLKASLIGNWIGGNWLKENGISDFGLGGYALKAADTAAKIHWEIESVLFSDAIHYVGFWHKGEMRLDSTFLLIDRKEFDGSNTQYSLYYNSNKKQAFSLEAASAGFQFYGLNVASDTGGFQYDKCGLVGAQFTHMLQGADHWEDEICLWDPDLVLVSFGTNEAYNNFMDTLSYESKIAKFMQTWNEQRPNTSFIVSAPPNTSSRNRLPPYEKFVIRVWRRQCLENGWGYFDLYGAMGGDSSWSKWLKLGYMGTDQLHFKTSGYYLQADMLVHSIRSYVRGRWPNFALIEEDWELQTEAILADIYKMENPLLDVPPPIKNKTHIVKSGETLSSIGRLYSVSYTAIQEANNLKSTIIYSGQMLIIPD